MARRLSTAWSTVARLHLPIAADAEAALPEYAARRSIQRLVLPSGKRVLPHLRQPHLVWRCIHFDTVCDTHQLRKAFVSRTVLG